jgi:hypothetical protein
MNQRRDCGGWVVLECREPDDFVRLNRFRYTQTVGRQGIPLSTAGHKNRFMVDPSDAFGINIVAESDGAVIAAVRLNRSCRFVSTGSGSVDRGDGRTWDCLIAPSLVHPDWLQTSVFGDLAVVAADRIGERAVRELAIDVPAGEKERCLAVYASMGFKVRRRDTEASPAGCQSAVRIHLENVALDPDEVENPFQGEDADAWASHPIRVH